MPNPHSLSEWRTSSSQVHALLFSTIMGDRSLPPVTSTSTSSPKKLLSVRAIRLERFRCYLSLLSPPDRPPTGPNAKKTDQIRSAQRLNSNLFPAKSLAKNRCGYSTPFAPLASRPG